MNRHDRDLVVELAARMRILWRLDRCAATAVEHPHLRAFWNRLRADEVRTIETLRDLIAGEVQRECF